MDRGQAGQMPLRELPELVTYVRRLEKRVETLVEGYAVLYQLICGTAHGAVETAKRVDDLDDAACSACASHLAIARRVDEHAADLDFLYDELSPSAFK
jgi:hypothetical protein